MCARIRIFFLPWPVQRGDHVGARVRLGRKGLDARTELAQLFHRDLAHLVEPF
jgi:hypothetical protein